MSVSKDFGSVKQHSCEGSITLKNRISINNDKVHKIEEDQRFCKNVKTKLNSWFLCEVHFSRILKLKITLVSF